MKRGGDGDGGGGGDLNSWFLLKGRKISCKKILS